MSCGKLKRVGKFLFLLNVCWFSFAFSNLSVAKITTEDVEQMVFNHFNKVKNDDKTDVANNEDRIVSLRFVWNVPVSVAAFERKGKIWVVFDRVNTINVEDLETEAQGLAKKIYTLPHPIGTIVIIEPKNGVKFSLRKEGLLWIVDLYTGRSPKFERKNITIFTQFDSFKNVYLFMPTTFAGNIISVLDPNYGDALSILTTNQLGLGSEEFYRYPDFDILEAMQGMAFVVNAPDVMLSRGNSGITLKAIGRSLNITSDLDSLKQQQKSKKNGTPGELKSPFDLQVSQKLAEQSFLDVVNNFKQEILSAPVGGKNKLRLDLAKYYVYNGLGTEALYILDQMFELDLPEVKTDYFHALAGVANFLAHRWQKAEQHFLYGRILDTTEGKFWNTIVKSAYKFEEGSNEIIMKYISLMRDYPQSIKDQIAIVAAQNAIKANDDLSAQNFIDILSAVQSRYVDLTPQITYLSGQKLEMQGYLRNAIKEYQSLLNSNSAMFSAYGRFRHTVLSQMINFIDAAAAIKELEKLRFAWGEKGFQIELLSKLANLYLKNHNYYDALRVLNEQGFIVDGEEKVKVFKKMVRVFEDVFIGNHADESLTPIKALALYEDFSWLGDLSEKRNIIMQKLADRLVAVDLLPRAKDILLSLLLRDDLTSDDIGRIGARLAVIYLFEQFPEKALEVLDATKAERMSPEVSAPRRFIRAKALSARGKVDQALNLLKDDYSSNALLYKFEIYWKAGDWDNASNVIKYLVKEPIKGQPLSKEQIGYILDWATTLKKAGKEMVLVRLYNKFIPYFKGTAYESAFNVLTSHLEKEEVDINKIRSAINDIDNFNNFAKFYMKSLEEKID